MANVVEILVKSRDQAKPDLDELKARLAELGGRVETARANVDDADAAAKLDKLQAQLIELGKRTSNPKISMAGALRAEAQIHALEASLDHLGETSETSKVKVGGLASVLNDLTLGLPHGIGEMTTFQKVLAGLNLATGLAEPLLAGVTVAAGGLAAGFLSAGAGLGIFGAVAKSAWSDVTAADSANKKLTGGLGELQSAVRRATGEWSGFVKAAAPGVAAVIAQGLALIPKALSLMRPFLAPVEAALTSIIAKVRTGLDSSSFKSFTNMLASNTGPAITKIATAIGHVVTGIGGILRAFMPVSQGMLSGIDKITASFAKWGTTLTGHSGFQSLMHMFQTETPLAISALQKLGSIVKVVIGQMTGMDTFGNSKMFLQMANAVLGLFNSVVKAHPELVWLALYVKMGADGFGKLRKAITGVSSGISDIRKVTKALGDLRGGMADATVAADEGSGAWGTFGGKLSTVFSAAKSGVLSMGSMIASGFRVVTESIQSAIIAVGEWGIGTKIAAAATKVWTAVQAAFDVVMDANPIGLVIIAIAALVAAIVILVVKFKSVRDFFKEAFHDMVSWADDAWHGIVAAFSAIVKTVSSAVSSAVSFIRAHWQLILGILTGPIGAAAIFIVSHWKQIVSGAQSMVSAVTGFFKSLPGRILSALGNLGSLLFSAGANVIRGLISGIQSMIGEVGSAISSIAGEITSHLPFSPAKKGPLSGAGDPRLSGRKIPAMLAQGITSNMAPLQAAAARMAGVVGHGGYGAAGGGYGGGGGPAGGALQLQVVGGGGGDFEQFMVAAMRKWVRVRGGNVQQVLGKG